MIDFVEQLLLDNGEKTILIIEPANGFSVSKAENGDDTSPKLKNLTIA
jgi:hypothetical protein